MKISCASILVLSVLQLAPLSPLASAADLPEAGGSLKDSPAWFSPLWQGFYLGGHAGGVWSNTGLYDDFVYVGDPSFKGNLGSTGFIGGGQAGYNLQRGHFVFGLEGDLGYLSVSTSKPVSYTPGSCSRQYNGQIENYTGAAGVMCNIDAKYSSFGGLYGDLTGRFGYLLNERALFYAKGGLAFLNSDFSANYSGQNCRTIGACGTGGPSNFNFGHSDTLVGWTVGGGVEYALNPKWSLKAEYQHFDFGSMSYSYSGCVSLGGSCPSGHYTSVLNGKTDVSVTADAVTVGVNYHLNNEPGSLK